MDSRYWIVDRLDWNLKIETLKTYDMNKPCKPYRILKPALAVLLAALLMSSVAADSRKERVQECASRSGDGAIYLKEFVVSLPKSEKGEKPAMYRQSVILRGNNIYRFNLCSDKGKAVIRVYDQSNMLLSSYDARSGKENNPINFLCRKTGQYLIVITEQSGKPSESVGIMSHVMK